MAASEPVDAAYDTRAARRRTIPQRAVSAYLFVAPFYFLFTLFFLWPTVNALITSLLNWDGVTAPRFVGLQNYARMFRDPVFWQAAFNTGIYVAFSLFVVVPCALVLAVLLNSPALRLRTLWRSIYFAPIVTSTVAITLVFGILYNRDAGLINVVLGQFGISPVPWLSDRDWAKASVLILIMWRNLGLLAIYFLAGLQSIPKELYESASIEGAGTFAKFRYITVPMLAPIIVFVSVLVMLNSLQTFDEPHVLFRQGGGSSGGPENGAMSIVQYLFIRGFTRLSMGLASAVGTVLFVVTFALTLFQLKRFDIIGGRQ